MSKKNVLGDVEQRAVSIREEAVNRIAARNTLRSDARLRVDAINKVCRELSVAKKKITIPSVVKVLRTRYAGQALSESSIRNNTPSGRAYRDVIRAWGHYLIAIGAPNSKADRGDDDGDIADSIIGKIKDERIRMQVLGLRTALRNTKRQLQLLQAVTPNKVIYHDVDYGSRRSSRVVERELSETERDALVALLNPIEIATMGLSWNRTGQLVGEGGQSLSRPGFKQAIERVLGVAGSRGEPA